MPLREPKIFQFERPCDNPDCVHASGMVLIDPHGHITAGTCHNDAVLFVDALRDADGVPGFCVACGQLRKAALQIDDGDWRGQLCRGHAIAYITHSLNEDAFWRMVEDAAGEPESVFALHGGFYADGLAWQPMSIGMEKTRAFVREMVELPGFNEEGDYDFSPMPGVESTLSALVREDYRELTGLDLDPEIAPMYYSNLIMRESFRRERAFPDRVQHIRPQMLDQLERLYLETDPQGLVQLQGAEPNPYSKNARDLMRRMHGEPSDTNPERLVHKVAQSFGAIGFIMDEMPDAYLRLAERIAFEVAVPAAIEAVTGKGGQATSS